MEREYLDNENAKAIADNEAMIEAEHQKEIAEQKLIEKTGKKIFIEINLDARQYDVDTKRALGLAKEIHTLYEEALPEWAKEAGYFQEEAEWLGKLVDEGWIPPERAKKYVQLADDQTLPKLISLTGEASKEEKSAYLLGIEDFKEQVLKAGWRKVIITHPE